MLDTRTSDDFEHLLNSEFELFYDGSPVSLTLSAVVVMEDRYCRPGAWLSFSLTFSGPLEPPLPPGIHSLRNEALGALDFFIVPLGPFGEGQRYEIVLN